MQVDQPQSVIIAVPLAHEHRLLQRCFRKSSPAAIAPPTLVCCGPGKRGMQRLAAFVDEMSERADASDDAPQTVILAGLAGALTRRCAVSSAHWIGNVVDEAGAVYEPACLPSQNDTLTYLFPSITTVTGTCAESSARRALAERTGADLVDLESLHFARAAEAHGWRWGIVRGISDGPDDVLPPNIDQWVDELGRTQPMVVARAIARQPRLIGILQRLRRDALDAMSAVESRLFAAGIGAS